LTGGYSALGKNIIEAIPFNMDMTSNSIGAGVGSGLVPQKHDSYPNQKNKTNEKEFTIRKNKSRKEVECNITFNYNIQSLGFLKNGLNNTDWSIVDYPQSQQNGGTAGKPKTNQATLCQPDSPSRISSKENQDNDKLRKGLQVSQHVGHTKFESIINGQHNRMLGTPQSKQKSLARKSEAAKANTANMSQSHHTGKFKDSAKKQREHDAESYMMQSPSIRKLQRMSSNEPLMRPHRSQGQNNSKADAHLLMSNYGNSSQAQNRNTRASNTTTGGAPEKERQSSPKIFGNTNGGDNYSHHLNRH